jgi:trk system potassium uptake protein TrkA
MKILMVGGGRAGLAVAIHLTASGHAVTLVDSDSSVTTRASTQYGIVALNGDATEAALLEDADVAHSDMVVAMLRRDADNLAVALLARAAGVVRVMVRMRDNAYRAVYAAAGIERMLSETDLIVGSIATAIEHDAIRRAMLLGNGDSVAFELTIPAASSAIGKSVSELASSPNFPASCVLAALYRSDGSVEAPRGSSTIHPGTTVLLVSRTDEVARSVDLFMR